MLYCLQFCHIGTYSSDHLISTYTGEMKRNLYWMARSYCLFVSGSFIVHLVAMLITFEILASSWYPSMHHSFPFRLKIHFKDMRMQLEQLICWSFIVFPEPLHVLKIWSPLTGALTVMNYFHCCVHLKLVQNWVQEPRLTVTQILQWVLSSTDSQNWWNIWQPICTLIGMTREPEDPQEADQFVQAGKQLNRTRVSSWTVPKCSPQPTDVYLSPWLYGSRIKKLYWKPSWKIPSMHALSKTKKEVIKTKAYLLSVRSLLCSVCSSTM
jgi:hypothetical protein